MIKIDFDSVAYMKGSRRVVNLKRIQEAQQCLNSLKPCFARVSGGKSGFHILKLCNDGSALEAMWDDPKRSLINDVRRRHGLTGNILFDVKSFRHVTRQAGEWQTINSGYDVEKFLDYWRV